MDSDKISKSGWVSIPDTTLKEWDSILPQSAIKWMDVWANITTRFFRTGVEFSEREDEPLQYRYFIESGDNQRTYGAWHETTRDKIQLIKTRWVI